MKTITKSSSLSLSLSRSQANSLFYKEKAFVFIISSISKSLHAVRTPL